MLCGKYSNKHYSCVYVVIVYTHTFNDSIVDDLLIKYKCEQQSESLQWDYFSQLLLAPPI